jgi:hypothetical protein
MTLPMRGIWKNSVLHDVLSKHEDVMQKNKGVKEVNTPKGHPMNANPPSRIHANSHVHSPLPGQPKSQHPKLHEERATKNSREQTANARAGLKFIPGTASALSAQIKGSAIGVN